MTLRELFDYLGTNPSILLAYFLFLPFTALIAGWMAKGEGHLSPWKYLYSVLVFAAAIPGIFALAFSIYLFLFERGSLMNADVLVQILPMISMALTLGIMSRNVSFEAIPGFDRLSSLFTAILAVFGLMWLLDRTRIFAFVHIPVHYLLLIVIGLLVVFRFAFKRMFA